MEKRQSSARVSSRVRATRREIVIISTLLLFISVCVGAYTFILKQNVINNLQEIQRKQEQIDKEIGRTEELKQMELFMQSREFIEKIAREKLGLVMPGETVIKPEE